jgi:hypothetical protein
LTKDDSDLGDQLISFGRKHEFADVSWYPSQQKVVYRIDDRVLVNTSGNGLYDFTAFRSTLSLALAVVRSTGKLIEFNPISLYFFKLKIMFQIVLLYMVVINRGASRSNARC